MSSAERREQVKLLKATDYECDDENSEVESFDSEDGYWNSDDDDDGFADDLDRRYARDDRNNNNTPCCNSETRFLVLLTAVLAAIIVVMTLRTGKPLVNVSGLSGIPSDTDGGADPIATSDDDERPVDEMFGEKSDHVNRTAIRDIRKQLAEVVEKMQQEVYGDENDDDATASSNAITNFGTDEAPLLSTIPPEYEPQFVDLADLFQVVSDAIDTIGVFGLYFQVFTDGDMSGLHWFWSQEQKRQTKTDRKMCWTTHGTWDCDANTPWWFYHYVGTATADKMMKEGSVLWKDDKTVDGMADLIHNIHAEKDRLRETAGDMSYHAEHGILWTVIPILQPDMTQYPYELAEEYCGDYYGFHNVRGIQAAHTVGRECYHGIGHAVFMTVARKQLGLSDNTDTNMVLRPGSGFEFTKESWCKVKDICGSASDLVPRYSDHSTTIDERCFGGVRHSVRIFVSREDTRWKYDTDPKDRTALMLQKMQHCD